MFHPGVKVGVCILVVICCVSNSSGSLDVLFKRLTSINGRAVRSSRIRHLISIAVCGLRCEPRKQCYQYLYRDDLCYYVTPMEDSVDQRELTPQERSLLGYRVSDPESDNRDWAERPERVERAENPDQVERAERRISVERPEQVERAERPKRVERAEQPKRVESAERPKRVGRVERPKRVERAERAEKPKRTERAGRAVRPKRTERAGRAVRPKRTERPKRVERPKRIERVKRPKRIERRKRVGRRTKTGNGADKKSLKGSCDVIGDKYCLKFYPDKRTWKSADKICRKNGGYLYVIQSDDKYKILKDYIKKNVKKYSSIRNMVYIGAADWTAEGVWHWVNGDVLSSKSKLWLPGEPNNYQDEDCAVISLQYNYKLIDASCNRRLPFVCEFPNKI